MWRAVAACLVAFLVLLASVAPVSGAPPGSVQASIAHEATLVDAGAGVLVRVTVSCAGGSDVLEAFVYVTQDGQQSRFTPISIRCGGQLPPPRPRPVIVPGFSNRQRPHSAAGGRPPITRVQQVRGQDS